MWPRGKKTHVQKGTKCWILEDVMGDRGCGGFTAVYGCEFMSVGGVGAIPGGLARDAEVEKDEGCYFSGKDSLNNSNKTHVHACVNVCEWRGGLGFTAAQSHLLCLSVVHQLTHPDTAVWHRPSSPVTRRHPQWFIPSIIHVFLLRGSKGGNR